MIVAALEFPPISEVIEFPAFGPLGFNKIALISVLATVFTLLIFLTAARKRELVPTGNVRRQANDLASTLADPAVTSVVLVTTPAELPVRETAETLSVLERESLCPPPIVVMNRTLDASGLVATDLVRLPPDSPVRAAAAMQVAMEADQAEWRDRIPHDHVLPFLRGVLTPEEVAVRLADAFGGTP